MLRTFKLAFRNLRRNLRRTLITLFAISGGLALMHWSLNLGFGMHNQMVRQGISVMAGNLVVQAPGYQEERDVDLVVHGVTDKIAKLQATFPEGVVTPRIFLGGLLTSPRNSMGVGITAIDPEREALVSQWDDKVSHGEFLGDQKRGALLGKDLAQSLDVDVGDKVVLMAQADGETLSELFRVQGLITTGSKDLDGMVMIVRLDTLQQTLGLPDAANQISVHLPDIRDARGKADQAAAVLGDEVEVLDWKRALPEVYEYVVLDEQWNHISLGIIGIIVAMGVLNTVLMSVMERIREFGVILALGVPRTQLITMVLTEAALLGTFAMIVGGLIGIGLTWPTVVYGLDFSDMSGGSGFEAAGVTIDAVVRAEWDVRNMLIYSAMTVVLTTLAAVYPAWWASRLKPTEAIQHV